MIKITKKIGMELIAESIDLIKNGKVVLIKNPKFKLLLYFPTKEDVLIFKRNNKKFFNENINF